MGKLSATVIGALIGALPVLLTPAMAEAARWYQVEVIIFAQQDSFGNEGTPLSIHLRYPERATYFGDGDVEQLPRDQRQLKGDAAKLERTGVYRVLFHEAWRQPGQSQGRTPWLIIQAGRRFGDHYELEGSLRLYLSTYLHLDTNLWLSLPSDTYASAPEPSTTTAKGNYTSTRDLPPPPGAFKSGAQPGGNGSSGIALKEIYSLEQSTRLQLGKLHYVDHPKMGILVKVMRTEAPGNPASAESVASETSTFN